MKRKNDRNRPRWGNWLIPVILATLFLAVRLPALGRFVTIDEVYWLNKSVGFRLNVLQGDWAATAPSDHPGVTTMWAGFFGIQLRFPELDNFPREEITDFHLRNYLWQHGVNPLEIVAAGRFFVVLFNAIAFFLIWSPLRKLLGQSVAIMGMGLIAFDPFLIAHQRLLHQDGLMAGFGLLAIVSFASFVQSKQRWDLFVSAIATGISFLTKSPMLVLGIAVFGLALWAWDKEGRTYKSSQAWLKALALWSAIVLFLVLLAWPATWTAPVDTIIRVFDYALNSAQGEFSGPIFFNGTIYPDGKLGWASLIFYPLSMLWRSTPFVWLGLASTAWFLVRQKANLSSPERGGLGALVLFALLFLVVMSFGEKKFDRYMLPTLVSLLPVAGWGLVQLFKQIQPLIFHRASHLVMPVFAAAIIGGQLLSSYSVFPYYLTYYNPLMGGIKAAQQTMMLGWGEGLEQAAVYLRSKSERGASVASWYSNVFALSYGQEVEDIPISLKLSQEELQRLLEMDYLVIYIHQWQRGTPQNLLDALEDLEPEYRVWVNGLEYVRIYHLNGN